jgi:hypothetical protein
VRRNYRGSSDIKASVDIAYKLTPLGDGAHLSLLELRAFKQRISVTPRLLIRYEVGQFIADEREVTKTVTERLVELLKANPGITSEKFEKLAASQSLGRNRARDFLQTGLGSGTVGIERGTCNRRGHFWREKGSENQWLS